MLVEYQLIWSGKVVELMKSNEIRNLMINHHHHHHHCQNMGMGHDFFVVVSVVIVAVVTVDVVDDVESVAVAADDADLTVISVYIYKQNNK